MKHRRPGVVCVCGLLVVCCASTGLDAAVIKSMFVFGDSLSDTGNVLKATQDSILAGDRPTVPWYDTGRWTNGTSNDGFNNTAPRTKETAYGGVWHERLADELKIGRAKNSLAGGTNWAYGGATTGTGSASGFLTIPNVRQQVNDFLATNPTFKDDQLYVVWGGGNDVRDAANATGSTVASIKTAAANALTNMKNSIAALAAKGAKRFLWPNLPPMDKIPEAMGANVPQARKDGLKAAGEQFRDQQAAAITMLKNTYPNVTIDKLDIHGEFLKILANPGNFGLNNVTQGVIAAGDFSGISFSPTPTFPNMQVDADKFLFWDQVHPTARTHDIIAMAAFDVVPEPATWMMILCVLPMCGHRRRAA